MVARIIQIITSKSFIMKTMRFLPILAFFILATTATAQTEPVMTLVASLPLNDVAQVDFQPGGEVTLGYWDQEHVQIEISIFEENFSRTQLKALVPMGIFRLEAETENGKATITMPGIHKIVTIGGKAFSPAFSFRIMLPRYVRFRQIENAESPALAERHSEADKP